MPSFGKLAKACPLAVLAAVLLGKDAVAEVRREENHGGDQHGGSDGERDDHGGSDGQEHEEEHDRERGRGPPSLNFEGRAPKLRIYPEGMVDENSTWVMLTFGKIQELSGQRVPVREHTIMSLAAERGIVWSEDEREVGNSTATVTRMELPLVYGGSFRACGAGGGGGGDHDGHGGVGGGDGGSNIISGGGGHNRRRLQAVGHIAIETYIFHGAATIPYGNTTLEVTQGQMKFNIESANWPFCGPDHFLEVNLNIMTKGDEPHPESLRERGPRSEHGEHGDHEFRQREFVSNAGDMDVQMVLPEIVVIDNETTDCEVNMGTEGGRTNIAFTFPAFTQMVYDATVGFAESSTTTSTSGTGGDGSGGATTTGAAGGGGLVSLAAGRSSVAFGFLAVVLSASAA